MSAIPAIRPQPEIEILRRPTPRPEIAPRQVVVARPKHRVDVAGLALAKTVLFGATLAVTMAASSLAGNVLIEKARSAGKISRERLRAASAALQPLHAQENRFEDPSEIGKWAMAHGYAAPVAAVAPSVSVEPHEAQAQ